MGFFAAACDNAPQLLLLRNQLPHIFPVSSDTLTVSGHYGVPRRYDGEPPGGHGPGAGATDADGQIREYHESHISSGC